MGYFPAKQIRPGLWIGSAGDARDPKFMQTNNIGFVVNCTEDIPFLASVPEANRYRIPVKDSTDFNDVMLMHFPVIVQQIDIVLNRGKGVLVHCRAGMQRSAACVAAYLMYKLGMSADGAMRAIKGVKNETFWPVPTFVVALKSYEKQLSAFNGYNGYNSNKSSNTRYYNSNTY